MPIQWFPGHMAKAKRQIAGVMSKVDLVIEVLDARLPESSSNPVLHQIRGQKPCLKVLNKNDLADPLVTKVWISHFNQFKALKAIALQSTNRSSVSRLLGICRTMVPHRGQPGKTLRIMVVGIPNVGKSTLINTLAGKKMARVGNKPAITTCPQQIDLRNGIHLADSPGLLWPNIRNQEAAYRLAATGAIADAAIDYEDIALFALHYLLASYPKLLIHRYQLSVTPSNESDLLDDIGRLRGCLSEGAQIDRQRAAEVFLKDLRNGLIGRISFEVPPVEKEVQQ
jgi:ribosome biogenesis GTPase A